MNRPDINNLIPKNNFQGLRKQHNKDSYIKDIDKYCNYLEFQNKELIEIGSRITVHINSNANTLTSRALLKLCGEFNLILKK